MPVTRQPARVAPLLSSVSCAVAALFASGSLHAQSPAAPDGTLERDQTAEAAPSPEGGASVSGMSLRPTGALSEQVPEQGGTMFITGDHMTGRSEFETRVEGDAELRRPGLVLRANQLTYEQFEDRATATGQVRVNQAGNVYEGEALQLEVEAFRGTFQKPRYQLLHTGGQGEAERAVFVDDHRSVIEQGTYSTCRRPTDPNETPAWLLRADRIELDTEADEGRAEGARIEFYGVPVLPLPSMTFPLSNNRKSGWLPPTFDIDNVSGIGVTMPYYFNIAPNRDFTFTPSVMSKRGVDFDGDFRYLEPDYTGQLRANLLPRDQLRNRDNRWSYTFKHSHILRTGLPTLGNLALNMDLNRVSDDLYWRDFPRGSSAITQRLLPSQASLSWSVPGMSVIARSVKWQTLQDVNSPILPPYDLMPQIVGRYAKDNLPGGLDVTATAHYSHFLAERRLTGQPNAKRSVAHVAVAKPWVTPGWFITPKVQLHSANYSFDEPIKTGQTNLTRTIPTFSLDSGLVFERDAKVFGRDMTMTLEPRAFYVNTPYKDQSMVPVYDSVPYDFNFATIYTENPFVGDDRVADNNMLTAGVTTRFLDAATGVENAAFSLARRSRFKGQRVTMPGVAPDNERYSDLLLGARVSWNPRWSVDSVVQYNPKTQRSVRSTIGARYSPSNYRTISAAYRLQRGLSEQVDVGWQWPLNDLWGDRGQDLGAGRGQGGGRWYSVGRLNYSLRESKLVDAVVGVEYDGCCWIGRVVLERLQSTSVTATKRLLFQIEFVGLARVGSNPLKTLRDNIPRYQYLRETTQTPSRFSNYE